jgi:hypothetical protein
MRINSKEIVLYADFYPASPVENPTMANKFERKIKLTNDTKIVRQIMNSLEEAEEYQRMPEENLSELEIEMNIISPPMRFKEIPILLSEIKLNDEICVVANENIKEKDEFFGQKIVLRYLPEE